VRASFCFPAGRSLLRVAGRGLPGGNSLFFCFAKRKVSKRKGDPGCCVPPLRCGQPAVLGPDGVSLNSLRSNNAIPDPSGPALLGASTRVGEGIPIPEETRTRLGESLFVFVPAPDCPVLAGPRSAETSGSGPALSERSEFSRTPLGSSTAGCPKRSAGTQTAGRLFFGDFLLAKQKKVTCCRAIPGQQPSAGKAQAETKTGIEGRLGTGRGGTTP